MMPQRSSLFFVLALAGALAAVASTPAEAGRLTAHFGPPAAGGGGANPVGIPPVDEADWEIEYVTDKDWETNVSIFPGLLFGRRSRLTNGVYVSGGGGLVMSLNGVGPGIYTALGWNYSWLNVEYEQALGFDFSGDSLVSPYALRIGFGFDF
jgi:hypothetical protein